MRSLHLRGAGEGVRPMVACEAIPVESVGGGEGLEERQR